MTDNGKIVVDNPLSGGGNEVPDRVPLPTETLGQTGLIQYSGRISEEFLKDLDGDKGRKVFREMSENDPVIGAILFAIDMLMRQVEWRIDPADPSDDAFDVAEFLESCMTDMSYSWNNTLSSILSMLPFGWSYHEIVYKVRGGPDEKDPRKRSDHADGKIGWRKIDLRPQDSLFKWEFDNDGGTKGMWQSAPPDFEPKFIPIQKSLLFRTRSFKNNPEGRSMLRNAYRPWFMKKRIEEIEAIGAERDLAGLPIAWVPFSMLSDGASADERTALESIKNLVASIKRDEQEGVVFPLAYDSAGNKRYDLTLLSTGGRRQFDTDQIISRYDQRIAMTTLADFILLGHENVGSFALGATKVDMFSVALGAWLDEVVAIFNRYAVPRLLELNNIDLELQPLLSHADVKRVDLDQMAAYITSLAGAGMPLFPDKGLEDHLREQVNWPLHEGTDEVAIGGQQQTVPPGPGQPGQAPSPGAPPQGTPNPMPRPNPMPNPAPPGGFTAAQKAVYDPRD